MPQAREAESRSCGSVRERLAEYAVGALRPWRQWWVRRHLARCAGCARELEALRRAAALVQELPEESAPADLWDRIAGAIESADRSPRHHTPPLRRLAVAGAVGLAAVSLALGIRLGHPGEERTTDANVLVRSHLALSQSHPFAPAAGLDTLALVGGQELR